MLAEASALQCGKRWACCAAQRMESLPLTLSPRTPGVFVGLREETFHLYTTSVHTLRDGGRSFK